MLTMKSSHYECPQTWVQNKHGHRQQNALQAPNSHKADAWGVKGEESKSHMAKLFQIVREEIKKQINKLLTRLTEDIIKQIMDVINKMIRKLTEDTSKMLIGKNKMIENMHSEFSKEFGVQEKVPNRNSEY